MCDDVIKKKVLFSFFADETFEFSPGETQYNFRVDIPENLPSSFESLENPTEFNIKYYIAVLMDSSRFTPDSLLESKEFKIVNHLNLNLDSQLKVRSFKKKI